MTNETRTQSIEFILEGDRAIWCDILTKTTDSHFTYLVPTLSALEEICKTLYWKPSIDWQIDECEVLNEIQFEPVNLLLKTDFNRGMRQATYTYLSNVKYRIRAHIVPSRKHADKFPEDSQNMKKHYAIAMRRLEKGGYKQPFLGASECFGFIRPVEDSDAPGFYADKGDVPIGNMLLWLDYPAEEENEFHRSFWFPTMKNGLIVFPITEHNKKPYFADGRNQLIIEETLNKSDYTIEYKESTWENNNRKEE